MNRLIIVCVVLFVLFAILTIFNNSNNGVSAKEYKYERFETVCEQGEFIVLMDKKTRVQYLLYTSYQRGAAITPIYAEVGAGTSIFYKE